MLAGMIPAVRMARVCVLIAAMAPLSADETKTVQPSGVTATSEGAVNSAMVSRTPAFGEAEP
jgi:hypothetical protein